jgi:hypothetical protein
MLARCGSSALRASRVSWSGSGLQPSACATADASSTTRRAAAMQAGSLRKSR